MKPINKTTLIAFFLTLLYTVTFGQDSASHPDRLPWVRGEFPKRNSDFEYVISRGEGKTLRDARNDALNSLLIDLGNSAGITVNSQTISEVRSELGFNQNSTTYEESTTNVNTYKIEREGFKASFSKVSEYYELAKNSSGYNYHLWELYEVSSTGTLNPIIPEYTTQYGFSAVWRSAIVPGWGQVYKKKYIKGIAILTSEAVFATGAVYCEMRRSDNYRKSQETTNITIVKEYRKRADSWELNRNVLIGGAMGIFAFNLLDAALAKGQIKYAWVPDNIILTAFNDKQVNYFGLNIQF